MIQAVPVTFLLKRKKLAKVLYFWLTHHTDLTYCVCSAPFCSSACLCSPCWSGVLRSAVDWGHRPHQRKRWRIQAGETRRKGWRWRRWRRSLMWTNASCRGSGSCHPALKGPRRSDWNPQARLGAAGCPPCLLWRQMKQWRVNWCNILCWLHVALLKKNNARRTRERMGGRGKAWEKERKGGWDKKRRETGRKKERWQWKCTWTSPHAALYTVLMINMSVQKSLDINNAYTHSHANTMMSTPRLPACSCRLSVI